MPQTLPEGVELDEETIFTGALLHEIREHRSVDLRDLSNHTKISLMNLRCLEQMQYDALPAPVYIRGFLKEYARFLRLPDKQVADTYMSVYDESQRADEEVPEP
jgi:flagellar biosynthesis protein FlhG